jgi:hypothetical protein
MKAVLSVAACVLLACAVEAFAEDPTGKWANSPFSDWFQSQMQDTETPMSCCGVSDGHEVSVQPNPAAMSGWDVWVGDRWEPVDLPKVYHENPTGKNWAWYTVYGDGTIHFYCLRLATST